MRRVGGRRLLQLLLLLVKVSGKKAWSEEALLIERERGGEERERGRERKKEKKGR